MDFNNLVNRQFYFINYEDKLILPLFVVEDDVVIINSKGTFLKRDTIHGKVTLALKDTREEAEKSLLEHYERNLTIANADYKEALKLVGLRQEDV